MYRRLLFLFFVSIALLPSVTFSQSQTEKKKALYFYSQDCPHCERVKKYFEQEKIYDRYEIRSVDVSGPYNFEYLEQFFDTFGIKPEKRGWPAVFFGSEVLVGDQPIIESFVKEIETVGASEFPEIGAVEKSAEEKNSRFFPSYNFQKIPPLVILGASLVDAINPCAIAVLLMLVTSVVLASGRKEGFLSGILFSLAVFLAYSFFGLAVYFVLGAWRIPVAFSALAGVMALAVGAAHIKDFIWYGRMFTSEIPFSWRPKMQNILHGIKKTTGAFGAGFLVSAFLLPCAGGPYLVVIGLLAERENAYRSVFYILLYNTIFILPMLALTVAIYAGARAGKLEALRKKHTRLLHGAVGVIMIFIGGYILASNI